LESYGDITRNEADVNRPTAFLLTGSVSQAETFDQVKAAFDDLGFDAELRAQMFMSAGPVEILPYVVVSAPVLALFTAMTTKAGEDAYLSLKRLCRRILEARRKGSYSPDTAVELEDTEGRMRAQLPGDLPDAAYQQLLPLFLTYLTQDSPVRPRPGMITERAGSLHDGSGPRLVWSERWNRWLACDSGRAYDFPPRRLPPVASRFPVEGPAELPTLNQEQRIRLYQASERSNSVIFRQRASIALLRFEYVEPSHLARRLIVSEELVRAVGDDYVSHGLPALRPSSVKAAPSRIPAEIAAEVLAVAQAPPREWQIGADAWTISSLANFVVDEGVIEDVSHRALKMLLDSAGLLADGTVVYRHGE
jgi:hypothetical protein